MVRHNHNPFDILNMVFFGVFAYGIKEYRFPIAPFILGFILGPLVETSLRRALLISEGDFSVFFSRPLPATLLLLALLIWLGPVLPALRKRVYSGTHPERG
ncbi:MAG: hypothetical protein HY697_01340 [Deltaproteobacteria bacterium]|nr:hypothetical protein [Deltaproteobacteria bacterium]